MEAHTLPIPVADAQLPRRAETARRTPLLQPLTEADGAPALARREGLYRRLLGAADLIAAATALLLIVSVFGDDHLRLAGFLSLPLIVLASKLIGLYDRDELLIRKTTVEEAPRLFQLATAYTLAFWLLDGVFITGSLGKAQVLVMWFTIFGLTFFGRALARQAAQHLAPAERILVIGDETSYRRLRAKVADNPTGATLVGRLSLNDWPNGPVHGEEFQILKSVCEQLEVHRIVIASAVSEGDSTLEMIRAAKGLGVRVSLLPRILEVVGSSVVYDDLFGLPVLGVRRFGLTRSSRFVKRSFDLAGSLLGLFVAGPAMLALAIAIKLDSPGPVFFRQTRIGRDGREFRIFKFRTMCDGADAMKAELRAHNEADGLFKIADDPRITRIGRLLRRTSLDELPQLINVVRGEMSLVGPRPLVVDEDEQITGWDRRRLALTPGMTGHWQILGSAKIPLAEMVKIDYLYVAGWSLWSDIKLLVRTVPYMLARRGM
ncbi:MAG TPA: sugar transferase [Capillimicrobium sp.]|nr:sugar transferase [Capillimicrobium sp.]